MGCKQDVKSCKPNNTPVVNLNIEDRSYKRIEQYTILKPGEEMSFYLLAIC